MKTIFFLLALSAAAAAGPLEPTLEVEPSGEGLLLRLGGVAGVPREVAVREPVVHVEYLFVPLILEKTVEKFPGGIRFETLRVTEGREISLGFHRARIVPDAVEDNPATIETGPFVVKGLFPGLYRARLVLDPSRQSVRVRALNIPVTQAVADTPWGNPSEYLPLCRRLRLEAEDDAASVLRLARDLEDLWIRFGGGIRGDPRWVEGLAGWRDRMESLIPRNDRRPVQGIAPSLPALRGALAGCFEALAELAAAYDGRMALDQSTRAARLAGLAPLEARVNAAVVCLDKTVGRDDVPEPERVRAALDTLRRAPAALREWHRAWTGRETGHAAADWPTWRSRFETDFTTDLFILGRAMPSAAYDDLAAAARLILSDTPAGAARNPSLLATYASRILEETNTPVDVATLEACETEIAERLARVERTLEKPQEPR